MDVHGHFRMRRPFWTDNGNFGPTTAIWTDNGHFAIGLALFGHFDEHTGTFMLRLTQVDIHNYIIIYILQ